MDDALLLEPVPRDVLPHSRVLIETDRWLVGIPLTPHAMYWWGAWSEWCVARERCYFDDYVAKGPLIVIRCRHSSFRWLLHAATEEFRGVRNKRASWRGFLMRNPELSGAIMLRLAET